MSKIEAPCIIRTDGTIESYPPADGKLFTLKELQKAVGGYIETVPYWDGKEDTIMFANEEGLLIGLMPNILSIELVGSLLMGDLVIVPKSMVE